MVTRRDLAEAQAFERRRVATAFVSGAPDGQEVEPSRPGRLLFGGLVLAALVLAGSAAAGRLLDRPSEDPGWARPGLLMVRESGALFVVLEERDPPVVHAVPDLTSARLLLEGPAEPRVVSAETLATARRGADLGLPDGPAQPPAEDRLVHDGWTACVAPPAGTAEAEQPPGLVVTIATAPAAVETPRAAFVVRYGEERHLVAQAGSDGAGGAGLAHRYRLSEDQAAADRLLRELDLPIWADAVPVPAEWLALLPAGGALDAAAFAAEDLGAPVADPEARGLPPGTLVGDVVEDPAARPYLVTRTGAVVLNPFAALVHRHLVAAGEAPVRVPAAPGGLESSGLAALRWPVAVPTGTTGPPCLVLHAGAGERPGVSLARDPRGPAAGSGGGGVRVEVEPGAGAHVRVAGRRAPGPTYLVDGRGRAHRLADGPTAGWLGYEREAVAVPAAWLAVLGEGTLLSRAAAGGGGGQ
ncbi:type VII secretion protein EccB [Nocardioides sp. zg-DK7169]|uniref:type VII secretion protein EccB n=1 Tax=Nocardioides sp. zg-DK7169 TaxID=2736600 RepID=UPI0015531419|nr:hypothetical protein [Nocardioides sp. zg-DK7169]